MTKRLRILLATRNAHKKREISDMLAGSPVELASPEEFPGLPEVVEDQATLEGNARKKAVELALGSGLWTLADDTGLEVEALGGAPGVCSARYAGPGCDFAANNRKLLAALEGLPADRRKAVFRTVMALGSPNGEAIIEEGRLQGVIAERPAGANGFGYDPLFYVSKIGRTLAEMSLDEKNALSHRAQALGKIVPHIKRLLLALAAVVLLCLPAPRAFATRTEPGQETIWDQIMASQANRDLRLGSKHLDDKQYDLALKEFQRAVAANPKDPVAHMLLGVAYYWSGQVDKSLDSYRVSLQLDPNSAQTYMLAGISLAWKGEERAAFASFKKAAELDPSRADIQMNLGSIEDALDMVPEALEHFRRAVALSPKEPLYRFQLGMLYRKLGRDQDAAESLEQALKYFSEFEDALLELGAVDERRGDRKAAVRNFKKAVELKSRDSVARFRLGRLYLLQGESKKAREMFADAFHLTPEEGGSGLQLSVAYAGGKKDAPSPGKGGGAPKPEPKEPPPASNDPLDIFARNLERIPLEQSALLHVDVVFVPKPKLVKAAPESASSLRKALEKEIEPERGAAPKAVRRDFRINAAKAEQRAQQIARILDELRGVMKEAPADADVRLGMNLNFTHLTETQVGRGDAENPPKVSYEPRQVGNDLGLWIMGTGWMALVEEMLPEPGENPSHPEQSDWWVSTGLGLATVGEGQRALSAFEHALRLDPKNEAALLGRGVASVMTGSEGAAVASFQEVLKINPKNRPAAEGLKWLLRPSMGRKKDAKPGRAEGT